MTDTITEIRPGADAAVEAALSATGRRPAVPSSADRRRHHCPSWCQTSDHGSGEFTHRTDQALACSLHPVEQPTVEAARARIGIGLEHWYQQNQAMNVTLEYPPGACEPFLIVQGHEDGGGGPEVGQQTRLSLAEGAELARILTDLVATGRSTA